MTTVPREILETTMLTYELGLIGEPESPLATLIAILARPVTLRVDHRRDRRGVMSKKRRIHLAFLSNWIGSESEPLE